MRQLLLKEITTAASLNQAKSTITAYKINNETLPNRCVRVGVNRYSEMDHVTASLVCEVPMPCK